jgi:hypothetical protein
MEKRVRCSVQLERVVASKLTVGSKSEELNDRYYTRDKYTINKMTIMMRWEC